MRIALALIIMAMISTMAYAADTAVSTSSTTASASVRSASAAPQPKGLKGDAPATKGKLTAPTADETTKAPASGSIPPSRLPQ